MKSTLNNFYFQKGTQIISFNHYLYNNVYWSWGQIPRPRKALHNLDID